MIPAHRLFRRVLVITAMLGAGLCLIRAWQDPAAFFLGWLPACLFWLQLSIGAAALLMIQRLTGGEWIAAIRHILRASAATLPLSALLFLPLTAGLSSLYPRAGDGFAQAPSSASPNLNTAAFGIRETLVFLCWLGLAASLRRSVTTRGSAAGLVVYGLTMTVFGIDWIMSLTPRWSSGNFGLLMMASPAVASLAFALALACISPVDMEAGRLRDLGNLLLAGILLWGYLAFQQYLAIWYENLPERISWYLQRQRWHGLTLAMAFSLVILPFAALLSRRLKRRREAVGVVAFLVLLGSLLHVYWLVLPARYAAPGDFSWRDGAPLLATGALWLAAFRRLLRKYPERPGEST